MSKVAAGACRASCPTERAFFPFTCCGMCSCWEDTSRPQYARKHTLSVAGHGHAEPLLVAPCATSAPAAVNLPCTIAGRNSPRG